MTAARILWMYIYTAHLGRQGQLSFYEETAVDSWNFSNDRLVQLEYNSCTVLLRGERTEKPHRSLLEPLQPFFGNIKRHCCIYLLSRFMTYRVRRSSVRADAIFIFLHVIQIQHRLRQSTRIHIHMYLRWYCHGVNAVSSTLRVKWRG